MARRMRGRGGARRQHRAASAPQTQARRRTAKSGRAPMTGTSARDARSRRIPVEVRPVSGNEGRGRRADAWTPRRPAGEGNLAIAEPPRRKAQCAPALEPRPPETGRAYPLHTRTLTRDVSPHRAAAPTQKKWQTGQRVFPLALRRGDVISCRCLNGGIALAEWFARKSRQGGGACVRARLAKPRRGLVT